MRDEFEDLKGRFWSPSLLGAIFQIMGIGTVVALVFRGCSS